MLTIILILMTITNACVCASNFNKGLRPYITKRKIVSEEEKLGSSNYAPYTTEMVSGAGDGRMGISRPGPARMEID